jgi:hypothetical protein
MIADLFTAELARHLQLLGTICQAGTAVIVSTIGVITYRYTRRQSALALINQNNGLANLVNTTIIQSEQARAALGKLHDSIVGCPDDAVLFMYLNYVHNTFRMHRIGAVTDQVWQDTLAACSCMLSRLTRGQVVSLLARGYERQFQLELLARFDAATLGQPEESATVLPFSKAPSSPRAMAG